MLLQSGFLADQRVTPTATGVGIFIAEHIDPVPVLHVLAAFRDPDCRLAEALDQLEALDYVRRVGDDADAVYIANPATLGGVAVRA
jgi:hypothetical protein